MQRIESMEAKRVRNSNIELLRIMAMVMIVIAHVVHNGIRYQLVDKNSIERMQNGLFCFPVFYKRLFLVSGILSFGNIGNAVFMLIAGYFLVEKGKNIKLGDISRKLLLQVGYAVVLRIITPLIYYKIFVPGEDKLINMGNINEFNSVYWFPSYYLLVVVVAGLFLNGYLETISRQTYRNLLLVVFGVFSLVWSGGVLNGIADGFRTLACGVFLYALGGYIKRYNPFGRVRTWALLLVILVTYVLIYLSYYGVVQNGIHSYLANAAQLKAKGSTVNDFIQPMYYVDNFSLVVVVLGVVLLELFSRIRITNNRIINLIAGGSLMVYLLHGHGFWITILQDRDWVLALSKDPLLYCFKVFKWSAFTFAVGIAGYLLYLGLCRLCSKYKYIVLKDI